MNYREAYGLYACNGILFNHESPIRGETFVTRKITRAVARIALGLQDRLYVGNLDAKRDWGHARDFVEAQWLILQQPEADDYVIATGKQHSVRDFAEAAFKEAGISLVWQGSGASERGIVDAVDAAHEISPACEPGAEVVWVDSRYFRPTEVDSLLGDPAKARSHLGWQPRTDFASLVREMVAEDISLAQRDRLVRDGGFKTYEHHE